MSSQIIICANKITSSLWEMWLLHNAYQIAQTKIKANIKILSLLLSLQFP